MSKILPLIATGFLLAVSPANAQQSTGDYPNRQIRVLVTVPAGGGVDTVTRLVTEKMRHKIGQPFVIENRGGAGGNLAAEQVFNSTPDGYQLMASQPAPITTNSVLYKKLNIDPSKFEFVGIMSIIPNVLLVKKDFPAKTAQEFVAYAQANPGKLNYASQGPGTTSHLTAELFEDLAKTKLVHVPYKGTAPALNDLVAGHVDFIFMQLESAVKLHEGKNARILAVTTSKRLAELPDIPTMEEAGIKLISDTWNAISAPPKTPAPIVAKLNATLNETLRDAELAARFKALHLLPGSFDVSQTRKFIDEDTRRWSDVIRAAKIPQIE